MSKHGLLQHGPRAPRKVFAAALFTLVVALAAPVGATAASRADAVTPRASWTDSRPSASWTDAVKPSASWTDSRPTASWTDVRPAASWTDARPSASWTDRSARTTRTHRVAPARS